MKIKIGLTTNIIHFKIKEYNMLKEPDKNKVKIVADSSCDKLTIPGIDFESVPLTISTDERIFRDNKDIDLENMLKYFASYRGRSYTSCPGIDDWLRCYDGADVLYVVVLSSGISGTYSTAVAATNIYKETHPEAKVRVFDTRSAGPQVHLLVDKIAECVRDGMDFEEVCNLADDYLKHTRVFFSLESFHNFAQNGRVNKTVAKFAGVLGIHIMATASLDGKIEILKKCRGSKATLRGFLDCMKNAGYTGGKCYIAHCKNPTFANEVSSEICKIYPNAKVSIYKTRGLCSYYAEKGGILLSCECEKIYK